MRNFFKTMVTLLIVITLVTLLIIAYAEKPYEYHADGSDYCIVANAVYLSDAQWARGNIEQAIMARLEYRVRHTLNMEDAQGGIHHIKVGSIKDDDTQQERRKGIITLYATAEEEDNCLRIPFYVTAKGMPENTPAIALPQKAEPTPFEPAETLPRATEPPPEEIKKIEQAKGEKADEKEKAYQRAAQAVWGVNAGLVSAGLYFIVPNYKTLRWYKNKKRQYLQNRRKNQ